MHIPEKFTGATRGVLITLLAFVSLKSYAQSGEEIFEAYFKDWYQVEVIIFERIESRRADGESWTKNISLRYPNKLKFLISQQTLEEQKALLDEGEPASASLSAENSAENRRLLNQLQEGGSQDPYYQKLISSLQKSELERLRPKEQPFIELAPELRQLNDDATRIGRSRSMSVLFHEAWRQPMADKKNASAIIVHGGEQFADHYELEGSLSLFLSRYLHIQTNLWLSEFEANFGQESGHWPLLPTPPWAQSDEELDNDNTLNESGNFSGSADTSSLPNWSMRLEADDGFNLNNDIGDAFLGNYSDLAAKPYVLKQLVTMRQKRRMRSGELHYIDHPKLGILIRIDRYEPKFSN